APDGPGPGGVLRQEHRDAGRRVGGPPGRPALRRDGLHGRVRGGAAVPRHAHPRHRRRHRRDPQPDGRTTNGTGGMTILGSTLDPTSPEAQAAAAAMRDSLADIGVQVATAVAGGGERYVTRHHDRGKLTARERVELLLDLESPFLELAVLAGYGS